MDSRCVVPGPVAFQLAGTLHEQLVHLRIDVERHSMGNGVVGAGLNSTDRSILALLKKEGREMRPREIEECIAMGKASVNVSLKRLEDRGRAVRRAVPCPKGTKAFAWRIA